MPNPEDFKSEDEFMGQCVSTLMGEGNSQEQSLAICKTQWESNSQQSIKIPVEKPKGKIEILSNIKKMIEKNGYDISEDRLLELFEIMNTKQNITNAKFDVKLNTKSVQSVKLFPKKSVYIAKYQKDFVLDDKFFDRIIDNFNNPKLFKPFVDIEHQLGEKYADVIDVYKMDDGLYAKIELNTKGIDAIKNKKYSYISPEWGDRVDTDENDHKDVLWAITLTNIPALEGENPTIEEQIKLTKKSRGKKMDLKEKKISLSAKFESLRLQEEIDPAQLVKVVEEAMALLAEAQAKFQEAIGQRDEAIEEKSEMAEQFDTLQQEKAEAEKESFFQEIVSNDQVEMKELDAWKEQYNSNKEFVIKMLASRPKLSKNQLTTNSIDKNKIEITKEDEEIMEQYGFVKADGSYDVKRYKADVLRGIE